MWQATQSKFLTFVVMGALFSGVACQSHMVTDATSAPSHHATHDNKGSTHTHHGTQNEESAPTDPCCVLQVADARTLDSAHLMPEVAQVVTLEAIITEPALQPLIAAHALRLKPPGNCSLLHQTCALLI